jgi:N-acetylglucosaminyldiphosphoundecaprenol N-acetyl-beta-D-mannosaminyltransferase
MNRRQPVNELPVQSCAGIPIAAISPQDAVELVIELAEKVGTHDTGYDVHLCNTYTLSLTEDPYLQVVLKEASVNLADGWPVVVANRLMHRSTATQHDRVRGPSLFVNVLDEGRAHGLRHYLLGSTPETLEALQEAIDERFPGVEVVGVESPPFRRATLTERIEQKERIRASGAQIVWVGLGTPKQDFECAAIAEELPVVTVGVGAAFDFMAGTVEEAPEWMQERGMEWAHRLASEPKRLWRRYLIGGPRFVKAVVTRRER